MALLNPGDECLVLQPFYGYHVATLRSLRMQPVIVPLANPDFSLDLNTLRNSITSRTRALILNTPANPSGHVFSRSELETLATLAIEHNLFVFTISPKQFSIATESCPERGPIQCLRESA